jgi:hypothetical protein
LRIAFFFVVVVVVVVVVAIAADADADVARGAAADSADVVDAALRSFNASFSRRAACEIRERTREREE